MYVVNEQNNVDNTDSEQTYKRGIFEVKRFLKVQIDFS